MLSLKSHDVAVLLKIVATRGRWTTAGLAREIFLSASEVHAALARAEQARLFDGRERLVNVDALEELMLHGLQYVFFPVRGELTRGMPTSIAAPPLVGRYFDEPDIPPVWPHPMGVKRGYELVPLYRRAPDAAAADSQFYEFLALTDALREGTPRVKAVATAELKERFAEYRRYLGARR